MTTTTTTRITETAAEIAKAWQALTESTRGTPDFAHHMDGYVVCILEGGDGRWDITDTLISEEAASWLPDEDEEAWDLLATEVTKLMTPWIQAQKWEHN